jgi:hypothetical protein
VPLGELLPEIVLNEEAPLLEERALDPAHEIFDGSLLIAAGGPAQLNATPSSSMTWANVAFHSRTSPSRFQASAIVVGRSKTAASGHAAHRRELIDQRAGERFHLLVGVGRRVETLAVTRRPA